MEDLEAAGFRDDLTNIEGCTFHSDWGKCEPIENAAMLPRIDLSVIGVSIHNNLKMDKS
jgi:hypothetical protein